MPVWNEASPISMYSPSFGARWPGSNSLCSPIVIIHPLSGILVIVWGKGSAYARQIAPDAVVDGIHHPRGAREIGGRAAEGR